MIDQAMLERHIGREQVAHDTADPERMQRLAALLDCKWTPSDGMPPLGHFLLFRPDEIQSRIGGDGHPLRDADGMLPPVPLPRRMWAGSRIRFEQPIKPGAVLERRSRLVSAAAKEGKSGQMVFCTVQHDICDKDGTLLISEEQDLVYRDAHQGPELAARPSIEPKFVPEHAVSRTVGPVELFRYSALTFNSHRIHYDREYARSAEGYEGLVVHGPLLATLLFDHLVSAVQGRRITEFSFRAVSPSFGGEELTLGIALDGDTAQLSVANPAGLGMSASAKLLS